VSILIVSCSLNSDSRSRTIAKRVEEILCQMNAPVNFIDLKEINLPFCDGNSVYTRQEVMTITEEIEKAQGILLAVPIYNYNANSVAKNLVELTGKAWEDKVVGFVCAAGGENSYMSIMNLANCLMLDFRCIILPQFVYVTNKSFEGDCLADPEIEKRIQKLTLQLTKVSSILKKE